MIKVQVNPEQKQDHCRIECQEQKKCRELARNPIVSVVFEKLSKNSKKTLRVRLIGFFKVNLIWFDLFLEFKLIL